MGPWRSSGASSWRSEARRAIDPDAPGPETKYLRLWATDAGIDLTNTDLSGSGLNLTGAVLSNAKLARDTGIALPDWRDALARCIAAGDPETGRPV